MSHCPTAEKQEGAKDASKVAKKDSQPECKKARTELDATSKQPGEDRKPEPKARSNSSNKSGNKNGSKKERSKSANRSDDKNKPSGGSVNQSDRNGGDSRGSDNPYWEIRRTGQGNVEDPKWKQNPALIKLGAKIYDQLWQGCNYVTGRVANDEQMLSWMAEYKSLLEKLKKDDDEKTKDQEDARAGNHEEDQAGDREQEHAHDAEHGGSDGDNVIDLTGDDSEAHN